ncbi:MAG: polysaccharide deacetylase family protein [Lentisphaerae bacterium]|nr:polysaccharide deacetylase family protein [Lentisphaerota bacterium]MCP4103366.1 polysaccharide deacetylase family protein [Lentisphaerota bacterium]
MQIDFLFNDGKRKALTFSYDDGVVEDRQLIDVFNRYSMKCTFHLNSGLCERERRIDQCDIADLYTGHEVACHSKTHPHLKNMSDIEVVQQILDNRRDLEKIVGYPVTGMSYPYGTYNSAVIDVLKKLGIAYSRTAMSTNKFITPNDFYQWHPTCHHNNAMDLTDNFLESSKNFELFYIWGHSYEFDRKDNWEDLEELCAKLSSKEDIWYATNIEIYEYLQAVKNLRFSVDRKIINNPSACSVWMLIDGEVVELMAGQTMNF